jgi:hypothetical protein
MRKSVASRQGESQENGWKNASRVEEKRNITQKGDKKMPRKKFCCSMKTLLTFLILSILWLTGLTPNTAAGKDYLSTGFGINEREPHPEYSLMLEFTIHTGKYLAAVEVDIYQDGIKIKSIHSPGPWLFIDLLPGNYSVVAQLEDGRRQGAQFRISKDMQKRVILSWPEE